MVCLSSAVYEEKTAVVGYRSSVKVEGICIIWDAGLATHTCYLQFLCIPSLLILLLYLCVYVVKCFRVYSLGFRAFFRLLSCEGHVFSWLNSFSGNLEANVR